MEREPGIERDDAINMADAAEPIREGRRADAADYAKAQADYAGGRGVDHVVVSEWLRTWGDADYRLFSEWLASRDV